jgi:hypothetical protein
MHGQVRFCRYPDFAAFCCTLHRPIPFPPKFPSTSSPSHGGLADLDGGLAAHTNWQPSACGCKQPSRQAEVSGWQEHAHERSKRGVQASTGEQVRGVRASTRHVGKYTAAFLLPFSHPRHWARSDGRFSYEPTLLAS